ncbi:hypothetical protein ACFL3I_03560 [Pseudomonadota bacterium]
MEDIAHPTASMTGVVNGDGFDATIDGDEYHFTDFLSAVRGVKVELAERLLEDCPAELFLHAATVVNDHCTIIIAGTSGSGKTTLALELVRRGMRYVTDEFTVIDGKTILPFPRSAVRKFEGPIPPGVNLEIANGSNYRSYMLPDRRTGLQPREVEQLWLIFPSRVECEHGSVRAIGSGEAWAQLMPSVFDIVGQETGLWPALSSVVSKAQSCVLEYGDARRDIDLALDLLGAA